MSYDPRLAHAGAVNADPRAYVARTLLMEPSPQALLHPCYSAECWDHRQATP